MEHFAIARQYEVQNIWSAQFPNLGKGYNFKKYIQVFITCRWQKPNEIFLDSLRAVSVLH